MVEAVTKTMTDITNVCDRMNRLVNTAKHNISKMSKDFEQNMDRFSSSMEQQAGDHAKLMQDILNYYANDENDELTMENEKPRSEEDSDSVAVSQRASRSEDFDYRDEFK